MFETALVCALSLFLVAWLIYGCVCFSAAMLEDKQEAEKPIPEELPEDTTLIRMSVEHLRWKKQRGYLWGGGWRYED